jgi:serine/threonine-protein kinase
MDRCAPPESLERLLAGTLSDAEAEALRVHLAGCLVCQAALDRLSDHPALHGFIPGGPAPPAPDESGLGRLLERLAATRFVEAPLPLAEAATVLAPTPAPTTAEGTAAAQPLAALSCYEVLRFHARGGIGEVLVARDAGLRRDVALKRMQRPHAADPHSRERFVSEAEITGRLEHPGIVPVYGLGRDADGQPFYAMRFVRGETLQDAIARFHGAGRPGDPGERALGLRHLLGCLVAVCNTVAYAHSRGVLHRDLKPSNVLLGAYGETLVVDWGLAKPYQPPGAGPGAEAAGAEGRSGPATQTGTVMGTPAFMSPEQAAGQGDRVGPASDVFALGAMLYAILTNRVPFDGASLTDVLGRARRADFVPPRRLNREVPRPLEAICLKAMAREPGARYAGALDLAADLEHWLADEPVGAWREPWWLVARRWLRRHRTLATAAAAAVLVALVSLAVAATLLAAARDRERTARAKAEENFRLARDAVDRYHVQVSQTKLLGTPGMQGLRKELLATARDFYQRFVDERADDPALRADLGHAVMRLGSITAEIDSKTRAIRDYERALALFEELARGPSADHREALATCQNDLARLYWETGQAARAETAYERALDLRGQLVQDHPESAEHARLLARTQSNYGALSFETGRVARAEGAYGQAVTLGERLVRDHAGVPQHQHDLALACSNLGLLYRATGRAPEAEQALRRAQDLMTPLVAASPSVLEYQDALAVARNNRALSFKDAGEMIKAEEALREALAAWQRLAHDNPLVTEFQNHLAGCHANLSGIYAETGRPADARAAREQALALWERLAREHADAARYPSALAGTYKSLGDTYLAFGRADDARRAYEKALALREGLARDHPDVPQFRSDLALSRCDVARLLQATGRGDEARDTFWEVLRTTERLAADYPAVAQYRSDVAASHNNVAVVCLGGQPDKAEAAYREAIRIQEEVAREFRLQLEWQHKLASYHDNLGLFYQAADREAEAEASFRKALAVWEPLIGDHPRVVRFAVGLGTCRGNMAMLRQDQGKADDALSWFGLSAEVLEGVLRQVPGHVAATTALRNTRWRRAETLADLGRHAEALPDWDRALELTQGRPRVALRAIRARTLAHLGRHAEAAGEAAALADEKAASGKTLFNLAAACSVSVPAARRDETLSAAEREQVAERYAARAVELLGAADRAGQFRAPAERERLRKETDFAPLRARDDFQKLLNRPGRDTSREVPPG